MVVAIAGVSAIVLSRAPADGQRDTATARIGASAAPNAVAFFRGFWQGLIAFLRALRARPKEITRAELEDWLNRSLRLALVLAIPLAMVGADKADHDWQFLSFIGYLVFLPLLTAP